MLRWRGGFSSVHQDSGRKPEKALSEAHKPDLDCLEGLWILFLGVLEDYLEEHGWDDGYNSWAVQQGAASGTHNSLSNSLNVIQSQ